jgi:hypothetical protein
MKPKGPKRQHKKHIIGGPLSLFFVIANPEKQGGNNEDVDEIYPEGRRGYKEAYYSFESMVADEEESKSEKNLIGPIGSGSTTESHPEEKRYNEDYVEYNNKQVGIHIYYRKSHSIFNKVAACSRAPSIHP